MKARLNLFVSKFRSLPLTSKITLFLVVLILAAISLTVFVSGQQQNLKQNAAIAGCAAKTDYLRQVWLSTTTFKQCESLTQKADDVASYNFKVYDCSQKYGVPASSMIAVQTPLQDFVNIFGYHVPNVSCVYTCATAEAVSAGERCVDNPSNQSASQLCSGNYAPSTSGHVCNPGRVCCMAANNTTCTPGVNSDGCTVGAQRCTPNNAGTQACQKGANGCPVWTTTLLCQNNTCTMSGSTAACKPSAECIENATRCVSLASIPGGQPQICKGGKWTNPVGPCQTPLKCDQLTGTCRCFPGDSCGATPAPTAGPTAGPTAPPTAAPTASPAPGTLTCTLTANPNSVAPNGNSALSTTCQGAPTSYTWSSDCGVATQVNSGSTTWKGPAAGGVICNPKVKVCDASGQCVTPTTPITVVAANSSIANFVIGLDGIGNTGDLRNPNPIANSNPIYRSNPNPIHKTRVATITLVAGSDSKTYNTNIVYDPASGKFLTSVDLGPNFSSSSYSVTIKSPIYLDRTVMATISNNSVNTIKTDLTSGDIDLNKTLNLLDYSIFSSCSIYSNATGTCGQNVNYKTNSDLNDNGVVDHDDYNLLLREWYVTSQ